MKKTLQQLKNGEGTLTIVTDSTQDLTVKGESIERLYTQYREKRYLVNRRYQRKLVWTLD